MIIEFFTKESPLSYDQLRSFKTLFGNQPQLIDIKGDIYYYKGFFYSKGGAQKARDEKLITNDISNMGQTIHNLEFHI